MTAAEQARRLPQSVALHALERRLVTVERMEVALDRLIADAETQLLLDAQGPGHVGSLVLSVVDSGGESDHAATTD